MCLIMKTAVTFSLFVLTLILLSNPASPQSYNHALDEAKALTLDKKYTPAIEKYEEACSLEPKNAECYRFYGRALVKMLRTSDALVQYQRALDLEPGDINLLNEIGCVLVLSGNPQKAVGYLKRAAELKGDNSVFYNDLGDALQKLGAKEGAHEAYLKSLKLQPTNNVRADWGENLTRSQPVTMHANQQKAPNSLDAFRPQTENSTSQSPADPELLKAMKWQDHYIRCLKEGNNDGAKNSLVQIAKFLLARHDFSGALKAIHQHYELISASPSIEDLGLSVALRKTFVSLMEQGKQGANKSVLNAEHNTINALEDAIAKAKVSIKEDEAQRKMRIDPRLTVTELRLHARSSGVYVFNGYITNNYKQWCDTATIEVEIRDAPMYNRKLLKVETFDVRDIPPGEALAIDQWMTFADNNRPSDLTFCSMKVLSVRGTWRNPR